MIGEIYMKQKEEGFVPVQYKILKLSSRMHLTESMKRKKRVVERLNFIVFQKFR